MDMKEEIVTQETTAQMHLVDSVMILSDASNIDSPSGKTSDALQKSASVELNKASTTVSDTGPGKDDSQESENLVTGSKDAAASEDTDSKTVHISAVNIESVLENRKPAEQPLIVNPKPSPVLKQLRPNAKTAGLLGCAAVASHKTKIQPAVIVVPPAVVGEKSRKIVSVVKQISKNKVKEQASGKSNTIAIQPLIDAPAAVINHAHIEQRASSAGMGTSPKKVSTPLIKTISKSLATPLSSASPTDVVKRPVAQTEKKFVGPTVKVVSFGEHGQAKGKKVVSVYNPATGMGVKPHVQIKHVQKVYTVPEVDIALTNRKPPQVVVDGNTGTAVIKVVDSKEEKGDNRVETTAGGVEDVVTIVSEAQGDYGSMVTSFKPANQTEKTSVSEMKDKSDSNNTGAGDSLVNSLCQVIKYDVTKDHLSGTGNKYVTVNDTVMHVGKQPRFGRVETGQRTGTIVEHSNKIAVYGTEDIEG